LLFVTVPYKASHLIVVGFSSPQRSVIKLIHVNFSDQEMPVVENTSSLSSARPPVFLHCGWRCRGTWIWNRFRELRGVAGFYEPLSETLARLRLSGLAAITAESWPSGHVGVSRPYFDEYRPLLRHGRAGVPGYQARFATTEFFATANAARPELHSYLRGLVNFAQERGEQPVLKLSGSIGRVGWMRRYFPDAVHVVVMRDPFTQFASATRQFVAHGNPHFLAMPLLLLAMNRDLPLVKLCLRHMGVEPPDVNSCQSEDAATRLCEANLRDSTPPAWYRAFLALWIATAATIPDEVDVVIDSGALVRSPSYRLRRESELARLTGRTVEFGDADASGDTARPDAPLLRRSEFLRAHATAEAFLTEQIGPEWADTRVMGHVARLLTEARSHAFGADVAARAPHAEVRDSLDEDPDFDAILLSAMGRAAWAEQQLAAIRASRSWRLTAPLRWISRRTG
jgi:hypothetical protein